MIGFKELEEATGGVLRENPAATTAAGISVDTRTLREGEVFFALRGPNFDGHEFVGEAFFRKSSGVVVERTGGVNISGALNTLFVDDTLKALGDTAAYLRRRTRVPLIAVSGSSGKTTTREMIAAVLERSRPVLKTCGNRNNLVGLPLTLSGINTTHRAAVVELGISVPGEMERLVEIADPDVALLTNIGAAHMEGLGGIQGVAEAKGELFHAPGPECFRVVNLDDEFTVAAATGLFDRAVTFSMEKEADVRVEGFKVDEDLTGSTAMFSIRGESVEIRLRVPGVFNIINAAAAIAALLPLDVYLDDICGGLSSFTGVRGRVEVLRGGGLVIIDDTYNANPVSVAAALGVLGSAPGRKAAVLGDMHELGDGAGDAHREAGRLAAEAGVDILVAVGSRAGAIVDGAVSAGFNPARAYSFVDKSGALAALKGDLLKEGDVLLVKGSRAAGLEEVVSGLLGRDALKQACC
ncbi:MAG: UDP-N-acetylmuramoyl-tripeptide--D-alanyl-D-alanine ligase [Thermodesulfobacteriota bacterium]|nr:MAG: UDP-N-acetylmuramoyl-tripeptide--D-alanyl-D-alanine ligase [Thermodesulfobacteriota bacterium]